MPDIMDEPSGRAHYREQLAGAIARNVGRVTTEADGLIFRRQHEQVGVGRLHSPTAEHHLIPQRIQPGTKLAECR
jgi:hypothetical protein